MESFIRDMYTRGKISAEKVWQYVPKYITAKQAKEIAGQKPEG